MVGDSETDVLAAKAANVDVACVRDGYNHGVDVTTLDPDFVITSFARCSYIEPRTLTHILKKCVVAFAHANFVHLKELCGRINRANKSDRSLERWRS